MDADYVLKQDHLREEIHVATFDGMPVFVMPKGGFRRKYAEIIINYGSNDNAFILPDENTRVEVPPGIAHFLEHKMFEKQWGDAFSAFAEIGASANAYTGNNHTSYVFWTLDNFDKALKILFEVVFEPYFTEQTVEKEQGIIAQEIRMYDDQPSARLLRETLQALYWHHPVRLDIAGTEESIRKITKELLYLCHTNFYRPSNASLFVAGDFDPREIFDVVADLVSNFTLPQGAAPKRLRPEEPESVRGDAEVFLPVPTPLVQVGWKDVPAKGSGEALVRQEIATSVLLDVIFGKSSPFFTRVYEKGLVDDINYSYEAWPDYAFAILGAESPEPERLCDLVHEEIQRLLSDGIGRADFERIKKAALGRYVSLFDAFDLIGETQAHLYQVGLDVFSYGEILKGLSMEEVSSRLKALDPNHSVRVIVKNPNAKKGR